jgi:hypothetical protein
VKYLSLLILLLFSVTPLCADQTIEVTPQEPTKEVLLLQETVASTQQDLAVQKDLLNEQQSQISFLVNSANNTKAELSATLETLSQSSENLRKGIKKSEEAINEMGENLSSLVAKIEQQGTLSQKQSERINSLENALHANKAEFTERVENVGQGVTETKAQLNTLGQDMGGKLKQQGYWVVFAALIGVFGIALGIVVRKKLASSKNQLECNLSSMRLQMEEENVKLDAKLVELLQSQMQLTEASPAPIDAAPVATSSGEVDHALPLKVGEEIFRMRQRLSALPDGTKGLKPLLKSLERLEEEFNQKGYELVDMLGKSYDDGLNVQAQFIPSDDLSPGERIINKIIKPQVNFNGVSIQVADIEVITGG